MQISSSALFQIPGKSKKYFKAVPERIRIQKTIPEIKEQSFDFHREISKS